MCKNEKKTHGTAATGVPVAEMLASEAHQPRARGHVSRAYNDPSLCLFPGVRSRESCGTLATPSNQASLPDLAKQLSSMNKSTNNNWIPYKLVPHCTEV